LLSLAAPEFGPRRLYTNLGQAADGAEDRFALIWKREPPRGARAEPGRHALNETVGEVGNIWMTKAYSRCAAPKRDCFAW